MSYWPYERIAATNEIIQKLMEYEQEFGVGAVQSIATVCTGNRMNEYYFEVKDKKSENLRKIPITSLEIKVLQEDPAYAVTVQNTIQRAGWHNLLVNPEEVPREEHRVLLEYMDMSQTAPTIHHYVGCRTGKHYIVDGYTYNVPETMKLVAWKEIGGCIHI